MCIYIHTHYIVCCLFSTCSGNMHDICFFMNGPGSVYTGNRTVPLMHVSQIVCFGETLCLSSPPRVLCVHVCVCVYLRNKMFISLKIFKMDTFRYQKWTLHWMEFQWLLLCLSYFVKTLLLRLCVVRHRSEPNRPAPTEGGPLLFVPLWEIASGFTSITSSSPGCVVVCAATKDFLFFPAATLTNTNLFIIRTFLREPRASCIRPSFYLLDLFPLPH